MIETILPLIIKGLLFLAMILLDVALIIANIAISINQKESKNKEDENNEAL